MSTTFTVPPRPSLWAGLAVQIRVIGALILREMHTRYGRDNIGYLWMIAEPLMLGSVIALLHSGSPAHDGVSAVAFTVVGYCIFIMFRGIVNRSEGAFESNVPLLYHHQVTMFDVTIARAILEGAGTFLSFLVLLIIVISLGYVGFPVRPLYLIMAIGYMLWISTALSLMIVAGTYENTALEKLVHPFTYFTIPISASFYQMAWLPKYYRDILGWIPLPHIFEMARYGMFPGMNLEYVDMTYLTGFCMVTTLLGLLLMNTSRERIHLH
ncbi:ABC transporter permease [Sphingomonas arantia]|uniref:ABC transporter permease n=1 Tax=Sphingomonas arantia TaxID=1460676 RepID=A0ABW4U2W6_9SPHN